MTDARNRASRIAFPASVAALACLQIALLLHFEPPSLILASDPVSGLDLDTHVEQAWIVTEALDGQGKAWAYDVRLLAGYPNGTFFDSDNKGWEIWTFALWKIGLPRGMAFNLFVWMAHMLAPWAILAAARMFGVGRWGALAAAASALALWNFDSFAHRCWWVGMTAYGVAGYAYLVMLGLLHSYVEKGGWWRAVLLAVTAAAAHMVHPYVLFMMAPPAIAVYARGARTMGWQRHAGVWAAALATVAANSWWLVTALRFRHYVQDAGRFGQSTAATLAMDFLGIKDDPEITGYMGNRTGFRVLVMAAAAVTMWAWGRRKDRRFLPFAIAIGTMLAVTYLGGYWDLTRQVQPYRHVLPAIMAAAIPAGALVEELVASGALRGLPRMAWAAIAILGITALPYLARDVVYFIPGLLPDVALRSGAQGGTGLPVEVRLGDEMLAAPRARDYRRQPPSEDYDAVARWVESNHQGRGRVLVEAGFLGEHLAWRTGAQILGGFKWLNMAHSSANLFRRMADGKGRQVPLLHYLEDYAVGHVIASRWAPAVAKQGTLFREVARFPPHVIFETLIEPSFLAAGSGKVEAGMNRISVTGSNGEEDLVLRFHWLETMICRPGCLLEREPIEGDDVGFMRVPAPHPADLEIVNGY